MRPAIRVDNLSKCYRIGGPKRKGRNLSEVLSDGVNSVWSKVRRLADSSFAEAGTQEFWALKDVSFEVPEGEVVGIIGRNGAGKSTLLKILSRIVEPTSGGAEIHGRLGSLLEVGTGFNPELTGRENIYLNGSILGMKKREIAAKFDEIVAFSEVEQFLDTPVKRYSSGMYVRLAFAVAAHLEPEVLIIDEVLAVGDAAFQAKCMGKMKDLRASGRTILFVSHQLGNIVALCDTAIRVDRGHIVGYGPAREEAALYVSQLDSAADQPLAERTDRTGSGTARFTRVQFRDSSGTIPIEAIMVGEGVRVHAEYESSRPLVGPQVSMALFNSFGDIACYLDTHVAGPEIKLAPRTGAFVCHIPSLPLQVGRYQLNLALVDREGPLDHVYNAVRLDVQAGPYFPSGRLPPAEFGDFVCLHRWSFTA